jgi:hypothetical protein
MSTQGHQVVPELELELGAGVAVAVGVDVVVVAGEGVDAGVDACVGVSVSASVGSAVGACVAVSVGSSDGVWVALSVGLDVRVGAAVALEVTSGELLTSGVPDRLGLGNGVRLNDGVGRLTVPDGSGNGFDPPPQPAIASTPMAAVTTIDPRRVFIASPLLVALPNRGHDVPRKPVRSGVILAPPIRVMFRVTRRPHRCRLWPAPPPGRRSTQAARILAFCAANSVSVRTPRVWRSASLLSSSAVLDAGAAAWTWRLKASCDAW